MENKSKRIEEIFKQDLSMYLAGRQRIDEQLPDAPDIEEQWAKIGESYLPDAMREFSKYPTVALGWIMFVGMAIAKYWDEDWELYGKVDNLYEYLRDRINFDHMDDYILDQVLLLDENEHKATSTIVAECAARTYTLLIPTLFFGALLAGAAAGYRREGLWLREGRMTLRRQQGLYLHCICVLHPDVCLTAAQSPWAASVSRTNLTLTFPGWVKLKVRSVPLRDAEKFFGFMETN